VKWLYKIKYIKRTQGGYRFGEVALELTLFEIEKHKILIHS
jgi:hypothetical protein